MTFEIEGRKIGADHPPLVVVELGINANGDPNKMVEMIAAAKRAGAECIKAQCHIASEELNETAKEIYPGDSEESLWEIIERCSFSEETEKRLADLVRKMGMIYLSTPFSVAAVERLERIGVPAYKVGSGDIQNEPLLSAVKATRKPAILSSGMVDINELSAAADWFGEYPLAFLHCTSEYPTKYENVRLRSLGVLKKYFHADPIGLSDHSLGIYTALGAVALGASIIEKHFTCSRSWPGPDQAVSIEENELRELIKGSRAIWEARGGEFGVTQGSMATKKWYLETRKGA